MQYDIYLGGVADRIWRSKLKRSMSKDLKIFDPMIRNYDKLSAELQLNQQAKEYSFLENDNRVVIFYLDKTWKGTSTLLEIGDAVARGKQVVVCLDGTVKGKKDIQQYCEFRGVLLVYSLKELISTVKEMLSELSICGV